MWFFCHCRQRERCDAYKEHDRIWHGSRELHRSSRLILFQMEMLNFAYINKFFLYARMLCQFSGWFQKWQHTPKRQWRHVHWQPISLLPWMLISRFDSHSKCLLFTATSNEFQFEFVNPTDVLKTSRNFTDTYTLSLLFSVEFQFFI